MLLLCTQAIHLSELYEKRISLNKEFCNLSKRNHPTVKKLMKRSKMCKNVPLKIEELTTTIQPACSIDRNEKEEKGLHIDEYQIRI